MTVHSLAALAVRITGIVLALYALKLGASYAAAWANSNQDPWLFLVLTPMVMMAGAGACMVAFPRAVAAAVMPAGGSDEINGPLTTGDLEVLGAVLLGLYFLVQSVLDAAWIGSVYFTTRNLDYPWTWSPDNVANVAVAGAEFIVAAWLLFGTRSFFALVRWARRVQAD